MANQTGRDCSTDLPKEHSLVLLTGVLGASTNWLLVRFLSSVLSAGRGRSEDVSTEAQEGTRTSRDIVKGSSDDEGTTAVVLVSWMRVWEFWRTEARRAGGLDLARLADERRFAFVDGLTETFIPPPKPKDPVGEAARSGLPTTATTDKPPQTTLQSPSLSHVHDQISKAISHVKQPGPDSSNPKRVLLILDNPDILLAAFGPPSYPLSTGQGRQPGQQENSTNAISLSASILRLRGMVHSTVITLAADAPLVSASSSPAPSPLEVNHTSFVVGMAHQASYVMSLRLLDTGFAADVSGVLRVTRGAGADDGGDEDVKDRVLEHERVEEREVLYHVRGDGSVKVFERGAGP